MSNVFTNEKLKKRFKVLLALGLLAGLIWLVGAGQMLAVLENLDPKWIVALLGMSFVLIFLSCVKWRLFIRAWDHDAGLIQLMKIYTVTYFYNVFAPSMVVGDIARSYHLGQHLESQKDAFIATFLERLTGLLAMVLLGTAFVAIGATAIAGLEVAILAVSFLVCLATLICLTDWALALASKLTLGFLHTTGLKKLEKKFTKLFGEISRAVAVAKERPVLFAKAMFWSVLFHFGTVVNVYVAALAVGWTNPDFTGLCVAVPLVLLVSIASFTPAGIGIQEGAFMYFLQRIGATGAEALAVGLVLRAKGMITAFVGWIFWTTMRNEHHEQEAVAGEPEVELRKTAKR